MPAAPLRFVQIIHRWSAQEPCPAARLMAHACASCPGVPDSSGNGKVECDGSREHGPGQRDHQRPRRGGIRLQGARERRGQPVASPRPAYHVIAELVRHSVAEEQYMYPAARKAMAAAERGRVLLTLSIAAVPPVPSSRPIAPRRSGGRGRHRAGSYEGQVRRARCRSARARAIKESSSCGSTRKAS